MRTILLATLMLAIGMVWAMPTPEEIKKAQTLVTELMVDDVSAFEKGDKTAVEVGDAAFDYAGKAETEAAKFVLYKGALQYFVRGKEYDKAAEAVEALRGAVKDVPPEEVVDLIRTAAKGVRGKDAPRLLAVLKAAQLQVQARKGAAAAKRVLKAKPDDPAARRALAEWLAVGGDWETALEAFAACGGKEKQTAEAEAEGKNLVAAADFWWAYEPKAAPADDAFKVHAAKLYRSCIADGTLAGLRKELVEKRFKQREDAMKVKPSRSKPNAEPAPSSPQRVLNPLRPNIATNEVESLLYLCIDLSEGASAKHYPITYLSEPPSGGWTDEHRTNLLVLRRIPAGNFRMQKFYNMTISHDFYLGVFELTQKQWELVMGKNPSQFRVDAGPVEMVSYNDIRGARKGRRWPLSADVDPESFMGVLRARTGLAFDLPTSTQWEYACRAGMNPDCLWFLGGSGRDYIYSRHNSDGHEHTVGSLRSNLWGLYDMNGNVWEWCLDWDGDLESDSDFKGPRRGERRVLRGGSFCDGWSSLSVYSKMARPPDNKTMQDAGLRVALTFQHAGK